MSSKKQKLRKGFFVTIEGPEGSGKTTLAEELFSGLKKMGYRVQLTFEPGASSIGKILREVLLHKKDHKIANLAELLMFEADRAQHVEEIIRPALNSGKIVISCRYFDSTTAYQGFGRGIDLKQIEILNSIATGGLIPDLTLLLDLAPEVGLPRVLQSRGNKDRLESEDIAFHRRLRKGFLRLAEENSRRFRVISALQKLEDVKSEAWKYVKIALDTELKEIHDKRK